MSIDDPVGITIRQAEEAIEADAYLPPLLVKFGVSAGAAVALAKMPWIAQIVTNLLSMNSQRIETRLLHVAEELNAQQKRIEDRIPDRKYYESEEFQTLLGLILEKLQTTHDEEKLRTFGVSLANCGSIEFQADDKENYIRTLRDLSKKDLQILSDTRLEGWTPHVHTIEYGPEVLSSIYRLAGMGLVIEKLHVKSPSSGRTGSQRLDAERALTELLTEPPKRTYFLSPFGGRFLKFIASEDSGDAPSSSPGDLRT